MKPAKFIIIALALTIALGNALFAQPPQSAIAGGACYLVGDVLVGRVSEGEGQYIGIQERPTPYSDTALRFIMVKTDPRNRRFTNSGYYWLEAFNYATGNWDQVGATYSYDGNRQDWQYQATVNLWNAPQGEIPIRFRLVSDNDPGKPKYSNRVVIYNNCK